MKNTKITVKTSSKNYPVYFGNGIINNAGTLVKKNIPGVNKICIISDKNLPQIILRKLSKSLKKYQIKNYKLFVSEKIKNFKVANKIIEDLLNENFNRNDCIIALGGGIIGDLSSFIASLIKRGIKFVNIPTTLLSQVDASIGGKTAVNSNQGKNLIGTFYQPDFVLEDILLLNSLPQREIVCGYGEILKYSLTLDRNFFLWLCKNAEKLINVRDNKILKKAIIRSCKIKANIVAKDEKEKNLRAVLNFGHTFAHGFEAAKNYSRELNHGEAVLLGMLIASDFSNEKKLLSDNELLLIKRHYGDLRLFTAIKKYFQKNEINKIINFMKKDKKNTSSNINLILLKKIGKTTKPDAVKVKSEELKKFLNRYY